jgi:hypothetical protein
MTSKVHSQTMMEFDPEVRSRIQNAQQQRRAAPQGPRAVQVQPGQPQQSVHRPSPSQQVAMNRPTPAVAKPAVAAAIEKMNNPGIDPALVKAMSGNPPGHGSAYAEPAQQWHQAPKPHAAPIEHDSQTVKNPTPGFVVAQADSDGTSVMLPSRFAFYGFEDLYVKPFRSGHLAKLSRANVERSLQQVVETVSTVIYTSTPGYSNLAFHLTMPDFYFVLYWLRQNSFTKSQYVHRDICVNHKHVERVEKGELDIESLKLTQIINNSTVRTIELERVPDPEVYNLNDDPSGLRLSPPTMLDVLEFMDDPMMKDANTRQEFAYLAQQAAHVAGTDEEGNRLSLRARIDLVESFSADNVMMLKDYEDLLKSYGVQEKVRLQCKVCGASKDSSLSLDASTFLSVK